MSDCINYAIIVGATRWSPSPYNNNRLLYTSLGDQQVALKSFHVKETALCIDS